MDCNTPGFPVLHRLPEFAQTHVHWVGDAIQPSRSLLSTLFLLPSVFLSIRVSHTYTTPLPVKIGKLCVHSVAQLYPTLRTPWTVAHQAPLSVTNSWSWPKLMSVELVMPSNHLILCCPFLLLPSIFPSIGLFQLVSSSHQMAKVLELQLQNQSFHWIFRGEFPYD